MKELHFDLINEFGRRRYYPTNPDAIMLIDLASGGKRKTLNHAEITKFQESGWPIKINVVYDRPNSKSI